ncbi:MAG: hypothetical protein K1W25_08865 [Lachnospiraceae bacterium]
MEKEQIYYGELISVTGGEPLKIPAIVIVSDGIEDPCGLPEKAEEILASCKNRLSIAPGYPAGRLLQEENLTVLTAQVSLVESRCLKGLIGPLNAASVGYVEHAVASSFGLGEILSQNDIPADKQNGKEGYR